MPALNDTLRRELEATFARDTGRFNSRQRRRLLALVGDNPDPTAFTDDIWRDMLADLEQVMTPNLERAFIASAEQAAQSFGTFAVDFDLVNQNAVDLARRLAGETSQSMVSYRRQQMQGWIADWFENKIDRDTVIERTARLFGAGKAEEIAITEITRIAVEGERPVIEALTNEGVMMRKRWQTVRDRLVCPICEPLDGVLANGLGFDAQFQNPVTGDYIVTRQHMCGVGVV